MSNIEIKIAKPEDAKSIRQVQHDTWITTYPNEKLGITVEQIKARLGPYLGEDKVQSLAEMLRSETQRTWLAVDKEAVIGYCTARKGPDFNKVEAIYVLLGYQGKRVGSSLIEPAFEWLGVNKDIEIEVASYNDRAINFYKRYGFSEDGRTADNHGIPTIFLVKATS